MKPEAKIQTWWDPAYRDAVRVVQEAGSGSRETLMKGLGVGYSRADFLLEILLRRGVLSESGSKRSGC